MKIPWCLRLFAPISAVCKYPRSAKCAVVDLKGATVRSAIHVIDDHDDELRIKMQVLDP